TYLALVPSYVSARSENLAENLSADVLLASFMVGHHALRGRKDGDAQTVCHARNAVHAHVDATTRLGDADDLADDGRTLVVLQLDVELGLAVLVFDAAVVADVAFRLEHIENPDAQLGRRRRDRALLAAKSVADAGQHIADRIINGHYMPPHLP